MRIIVPIKQVPDTHDVRIDPETGTLIREGVPSIVNPEDKNALEMALTLKEQVQNAWVIAISMGPPQAEAALREALAMGADEAILLSDRAFAGADTLATACALSSAIRKIGQYDLVICGRQAIDGDTAQVGPQLAEFLQLPQATYARAVELDIENRNITVERVLESEIERLTLPLPALITCLKEANQPRIPTLRGCISAYREKPFRIWKASDLDIPLEQIGLKGSPTQVRRTFTPPPKGAGITLQGEPKQLVKKLLETLQEKGII